MQVHIHKYIYIYICIHICFQTTCSLFENCRACLLGELANAIADSKLLCYTISISIFVVILYITSCEVILHGVILYSYNNHVYVYQVAGLGGSGTYTCVYIYIHMYIYMYIYVLCYKPWRGGLDLGGGRCNAILIYY